MFQHICLDRLCVMRDRAVWYGCTPVADRITTAVLDDPSRVICVRTCLEGGTTISRYLYVAWKRNKDKIIVFAELAAELTCEEHHNVVLRFALRDAPYHRPLFSFTRTGAVARDSWADSEGVVSSISSDRIATQTYGRGYDLEVVETAQPQNTVCLWDSKMRHEDLKAAFPKSKPEVTDEERRMQAGMTALGSTKHQAPNNGGGGGTRRVAPRPPPPPGVADGAAAALDAMMPVEVVDSESSSDENEFDVEPSAPDAAPAAPDMAPAAPEVAPAAPVGQPPPPSDVDAHKFLWLVRTNYKSSCFSCRGPVEKGTMKIIYDPHPSAAPANRQWKPTMWKYVHLQSECLRSLQLMSPWLGQAEQVPDIAVDVAPLPKAANESQASRHSSIADAQVQFRAEWLVASQM